MFSELMNVSTSTLKYLFHIREKRQQGYLRMSEEIRNDLIQRMKQKVIDNRTDYTITPEGIDFVVKNEDVIRFNEGTVLKYNLPFWALTIFEKHIPRIRKSIQDSRLYPSPQIVKIAILKGQWHIKFDNENLSLITYIKVDELCEELEKVMLYNGK